MSTPNGAPAPSDAATPEPMPLDGAIDSAIQEVEAEVVDTRAIKAEQEAAELKQHLRAQQEMIAELRKTTVSQSEMLSELVGGMRDAKDRGFAYERERLEAIQDKAAAEADVVTHREAARAIRALEQQYRTLADQKTAQQTGNQPGQPASPDPAAIAWMGDNPWFNTDPKLRAVAIAVDATLLVDEPHLSVADRLKKVREAVVSANPSKFSTQAARPQPPTVSRPGSQTASRTAKPKEKTEADLPAEDRAIMDRLVGQKVLTKAQYLKDYQWDK